ncbi:hypothetical protein DFH07DRAFT_965807 [Mycena maculata]|uniref:MFS general substrate transporter n=1 Tax=Mycena maculata TaxID=230809 RepID=A0AAD7IBD0_9AGAR|nr:hypothetical protein DFH07DRAFT_965807 [Mycena maculata]
MLSLCKPDKFYQIFLAQGLGAVLGTGMVYVPSVVAVTHYFNKRRSIAITIVAAGSSLGAVVHPIMLNNTLQTSASATPTSPPPPSKIPAILEVPAALRPRHTIHLGDYQVGILSSALTLIPSSTLRQNFPLINTDFQLVIMNSSSFVGRLSPSLFVARIGVVGMVVIAAGCRAVLIFCMIALKTVASVIVLGILYGFWAGYHPDGPLVAVLIEDRGELGLRIK